jgi:hypothetical protein
VLLTRETSGEKLRPGFHIPNEYLNLGFPPQSDLNRFNSKYVFLDFSNCSTRIGKINIHIHSNCDIFFVNIHRKYMNTHFPIHEYSL